ncbi:SPOR domain-containing protein [Flavobacterium sp.]|uniref:SPOR domain-containing protein n=1 Tax=Flavobacterium sp. TaxID=239 RepID=UPI00262DA02D|nr:SPOR domain-containing protein [Flavobacterium sp.]MDD2985643.1 SPOR domain-containing protein [Flavobacterium sp.]
MLFLKRKKPFKSLLIIVLFVSNLTLLAQNSSIEQDPKFEQLLNEKRKVNASVITNDRWKIQIFTGDNENSKKTLIAFKKEYKDIDASIFFHTPVYKVWVGNFKTRVEAERNLKEIKLKYPNSFLIKPVK